jgi:hypothetical protein
MTLLFAVPLETPRNGRRHVDPVHASKSVGRGFDFAQEFDFAADAIASTVIYLLSVHTKILISRYQNRFTAQLFR